MVRRSVRLVVIAALAAFGALPLGAFQGGGFPPVTVVNPTPNECFSGAGCLDPTFGTLGKVQVDVAGGATGTQSISDSALQPDGKLVVLGNRLIPLPTGGSDWAWIVARFLPDGSADAGFGAGGFVVIDAVTGPASEQPTDMTIQSDGKILVAGSANNLGVILRLTGSGSLDSTYGTGGKVTFSNVDVVGVSTIALEPDGKILAVTPAASGTTSSTKVHRLKPNGSVDKTFGVSGSRTISGFYAHAMTRQSTGRIVLAGSKTATGDAMVARLTSSGAIDTSFGSAGSTVVNFSVNSDSFFSVSLAVDDSIVANGHANFTNYATRHMAVARLNANGALVSSFGNGGRVVLDMHGADDWAYDAGIQADGRVIFVGYGYLAGHTKRNVIVGRLLTNGTLDPSFGSAGVTETDLGPNVGSMAATMVIANGGITLAGFSADKITTPSTYRWLIARYFQ